MAIDDNGNKPDPMRTSFALLFYVSRKWEVISNRILNKAGITLKQLLLLIVIKHQFNSPPSINEVAKVMSTSHQNIKAIAENLQKKKLLNVKRDNNDKRIWRLAISPESAPFWENRALGDSKAMSDLYSCLSPAEISVFSTILKKLMKHTETLEQGEKDLQ